MAEDNSTTSFSVCRSLAIAAAAFLFGSGTVFAMDARPAPDSPPRAPIRLTAGAAPATQAVIDTLAARDAALFDAVFGCKVEALPALVADDFEFLHDKSGKTAGSGAQFIESIAKNCAAQKAGTNFEARRELVPGTMTVHMLNNYGAMQMGTHRFYAVQPGQPDRLTETGKFIDVWRLAGGAWKLSRVISYDHQLAE